MNDIWKILDKVLEIYREIEPLEKKINKLYDEAEKIIKNKKYDIDDDFEFKQDRDYLDCIESYK